MSKQIEDSLLYLLRQIKGVLDQHHVMFWLECGTLLGAVRDGTFIPWEKDIDFSIWRHEVSDKALYSIVDSLQKKDFSVRIAEGHMNVRSNGPCHLDINFYEIHGDKAVMPSHMPMNILGKFLNIWIQSLIKPTHPRDIDKVKTKTSRIIVKSSIRISKLIPCFIRKYLSNALFSIYKNLGAKDISWVVPIKYFSDFSTIDFYGTKFNIPTNVESYLEFRYGKDWETPTQDWIHHEDDGACQESIMAVISN